MFIYMYVNNAFVGCKESNNLLDMLGCISTTGCDLLMAVVVLLACPGRRVDGRRTACQRILWLKGSQELEEA